ncbi:Txe/YoeB family addiction module toxin [Lactobacillus kefiranofaciens]|uniref:Endoribonuclease YoeB n=1 Tax=Lactobacillus kefiranofaciens TaxID=267818 RepID=A0AAX3UCW0_9LACO|nr:Txe/YoeB family addiction module toxin [Lactobacillus kefiranofaciens]AEG41023.1 Toxin [Lactobacillus kefiranofaciens subsp. kefiranofaciens]KRM20806.1 toxin [Lactobacillus kefiranofaciens subsp. kefiranofaciens DSM 5016 = JCM 6985]MCP9331665.1 Txe/YoeB family addiction module toxin [Lactobacillus kefiranofaciens]URW70858.1 Txe/YoeB family addiction module toxin [Lactobacillus kefiranofaciens subsp. kefirgranum]URW72802.1 Txe/YoeB family addiction module toxin [Lactobacillus kefiranofaciens
MLSWTDDGCDDYLNWQKQRQKKKIKRINKLITDIKRHPFEGMGKPEGLKNNLTGLWSRKIDAKNRIIYEYTNENVIIYSCKDHYDDH